MKAERRKRIYILGAGVMQIPAIRAARDFGWEVVCSDGNSKAPGIEESDFFEHIDIRDKEKIAESVVTWKNGRGLDGVFTAGTDFSACVAYAAEKADLPGIGYETALNASDKARMRQVFHKYQVPSPRFVEVCDGGLKEEALASISFPLVVKPVDNMGARGIRRVDCKEEYNEAFERAMAYSASKKVIIEEYLEGPEFSIDALVFNGEINICGVADRIIRFPPYFIETGHTMPTEFGEVPVKNVVQVFKQGVKALGINNGAAKGDIKLTPRGAVVGEIAARLSGGFMSGWTYPLSSGVNLTAAALKIAVGEHPGSLEEKTHKISAERAFYSIPGTIQSIEGFDRQAGNAAFLSRNAGDVVSFPHNNVEKCGNYIFSHNDRNSATSAAEEACRNVLVRLKPGELSTLSFLQKRSDKWVPDAYQFTVRENRDWIKSLKKIPDKQKIGESGITIGKPPLFEEEINFINVDWMGRTMLQSLNSILKETGIRQVTGDGSTGAGFWHAFFRGGIQGGIWYIDTLKEFINNKSYGECFSGWDNSFERV